jgi:hypothetical protein
MESSKPLRLCCFNAHYPPRTSLGTAAARVGQRLRGSTPGPLGPLPSHSWILGRPYVLQTARDDGHGRAYQSLTINVQESWLPCYPLFVDPGMSDQTNSHRRFTAPATQRASTPIFRALIGRGVGRGPSGDVEFGARRGGFGFRRESTPATTETELFSTKEARSARGMKTRTDLMGRGQTDPRVPE